MSRETIAHDVNTLAGFLGKRDVSELTPDSLAENLGFAKTDVCVLFGGAILGGADVLAAAMRAGVSRRYAIVGGVGHTTAAFRGRVRALCPDVDLSDGDSEADIFAAYLRTRYGLAADVLERRSTNCGENVTFLRDLLAGNRVECETMILIHDESMQRRIELQVRKEMPGVTPVSFASYRVNVVPRPLAGNRAEGTVPGLAFDGEPFGIWTMREYLTLLMGEVPRLHDDESGYGPKGKGFLPHVDVPSEVWASFLRLRAEYPECVRRAFPTSPSPSHDQSQDKGESR